MAHIAINIDEQIKRLSERNMILDIEEFKIKEILLDIGYYRLGFYWHPFEYDDNHNFIEGTKFSDVISLYYLDVDLRYLLIKYINRLELNFRTNLIHWCSLFYGNNPIWYADKKIMSVEYMKSLKKHYNKHFISKNSQISKHHLKHKNDTYAPCWKTFEYYTFGSIARVYENILDDDLKKTISLKYNIKKPYKLQNYLNTLVFVRNSCAHSGVIYDLSIINGISDLPNARFNNNNHNLDSAIKVLLYLIENISTNRKNDLEVSIIELFSKYSNNQIIKNIIEEKTGYIFS
jgi:abortive infection bacteriophage resistance protein